MLLVGAGAAMAKALTLTTACASPGAGQTTTSTSPGATPAGGEAASILAAALDDCLAAGRTCMQHCLQFLRSGDTSLADCSQVVYEMIAACEATLVLARASSPHLGLAARLCEAVCSACEVACAKHEGHHEECAACAAACRPAIAAAKAIA